MPRIQINLVGSSTRAGASWTITTNWAVASLPTAAAMATALAAARTALVASAPFRAGVGSNYSLVTLRALGYATGPAPALWTVDASGSAVAGTGVALTPPLALVVSEQTGAAGPSYRGRSYWPGTGSNPPDQQGNVATANQGDVRTAWIAMHSTLLAALVPLGGTPVHVVYSRKTNEMTPITVIRTGNRIDTSRGRFGDTPENYVSQAVPGVVTLAIAPEGGEVDAAALGLPPDATDDDVQAYLQQIADHAIASPLTIGPLKTALAAIATALAFRRGAE